MLKIRRPLGRLIFNMGIAIPGKTVFLWLCQNGTASFTKSMYLNTPLYILSLTTVSLVRSALFKPCCSFDVIIVFLYTTNRRLNCLKTHILLLPVYHTHKFLYCINYYGADISTLPWKWKTYYHFYWQSWWRHQMHKGQWRGALMFSLICA